MITVELFFPGEPGSKQSTRFAVINGRPVAYQSNKIKQAEASIRMDALYQLQQQKVNPMPFKKWAKVKKCIFVFSPLKSHKKGDWQKIEEGQFLRKTTKPDLTDNLKKGLFDALQGILYANDSIICEEENTGKFYGKKPGVYLLMEGE